MACPKCGGEVWDNRAKKASGEMKPTAPNAACKDRDGCGWKDWPPKGAKPAYGRPGGPTPVAARGPKYTWDTLGSLYARCVDIGYMQAARIATGAKIPLTMDAVLAASATIFICASRDGVQEAPTKIPDAVQDEDRADWGAPY